MMNLQGQLQIKQQISNNTAHLHLLNAHNTGDAYVLL